jgi:hypothetical protein
MVPLFAQMMKYLHDNGFKVLTMNQLGYDTTNNLFCIKNVQSPTSTPTTIAAATAIANAATKENILHPNFIQIIQQQ